jgi:transcriptional regulator with XRE-family HTH domain
MRHTLKRRVALADFLKTRRARLRPEQFDLPTFNRRRTPGLRREELAQLAGVGVSWYTWLEQGRDIHVSDQVLERLAQVLQLNKEERCHLFNLVRGSAAIRKVQEHEILPSNVAYQAILDALGIYPAQLLDRHLNVVAWNESARRVIGDFASFSERERNVSWFVFMYPPVRKLIERWEHAARQNIALLHAISDQSADDKLLMELIADLRHGSPEFRAWWSLHDIRLTCNSKEPPGGINHPLVGRLMLQPTTLIVPERPDLRMVVHMPLPQEDTEAKLKVLMSSGSQSALAQSY